MKNSKGKPNTSIFLTQHCKKWLLSAAIGSSLALLSAGISAASQESTEHSTSVQSLINVITSQPSYGVTGNEYFQVTKEWKDSLGKQHTRFNQTISGLKVYGSSVILHSDVSDNNTRIFQPNNHYEISGTIAKVDPMTSPQFMTRGNYNSDKAYEAAKNIGEVQGSPELAYIYLPESEETKLAWKVEVHYDSKAGFEHDVVFFDVSTNELLDNHPQVHRAMSVETYDMHGMSYWNKNAPGNFDCNLQQQPCSDSSAQNAQDGAVGVYKYYFNTFGRDSMDNKGMTILSSVHVGAYWPNAAYYKNQMMYGDGDGDGDGKKFGDMTGSYDVIAHELTHGVVNHTAGLINRNESGALNEEISDIFAAIAEARKNGFSIPDWRIGEGVYLLGDALRYLDNPTKNPTSKDYYPERYTEDQDRGGVHWNSGIGSLAYVLLVQGGTHPRNKTDVIVDGIGLEKAEQIFYRALTTYFTVNTDFSQAKIDTMKAAQDLYGATAEEQVKLA